VHLVCYCLNIKSSYPQTILLMYKGEFWFSRTLFPCQLNKLTGYEVDGPNLISGKKPGIFLLSTTSRTNLGGFSSFFVDLGTPSLERWPIPLSNICIKTWRFIYFADVYLYSVMLRTLINVSLLISYPFAIYSVYLSVEFTSLNVSISCPHA
jgi:hypothetical protein